MPEQTSSFIGRLFSRFSLVKKFIIISCVFLVSIIIAISWMTHMQNQVIEAINLEIMGNKYERLIRGVYFNVAIHRKELMDGASDKQMNMTPLAGLEKEIQEGFENLVNYDLQIQQDLHTQASDFESFETQNLKPAELYSQWNQMVLLDPNRSHDKNNKMHLDLLSELQELIFYIAERSNLLQDSQIDNYYLIHTLYHLVTDNLTSISDINKEYEKYLQEKDQDPKKTQEHLKKINNNLAILNLHLNEAKENIHKAIFYKKKYNGNSDLEKKLQAPLNNLVEAIGKYSEMIESHILSGKQDSLLPQIRKVYQENFALSDVISEIIEQMLQNRLDQVKKEQWLAVTLTLLIAIIAFLLGIAVMESITAPLNQMMKAAISIGNGDLSVRVPVIYDDEVGKVAKAFNKMADSIQDLIKQLHWAGIQLSTSTTEIAATAKQQEITALEQESTTKQIAVTAKEISATTGDFAKTMKDISDTAEKTSSLAIVGKDGLLQMEMIMRQMVEAASNIAAKLAVLNEKATIITGVVTTIAKVADQTNLLSLNAAIEAEKAGEHGRSFSVIAREIRRLADQSANATLDIEKMVNEMVSAVSAGVTGVDKFTAEINTGVNQVNTASEQLSKIIEQVQQLTSSFEIVNQGMQGQALRATQINDSILQLSETAQQTSASIHQFQKSIEQLNNAARGLQSIVTTT